jgi:hypothetical protein
MSWLQDLASRINALKDENWETELMIGPNNTTIKTKSAQIKLPIDGDIGNQLFSKISHVNSEPCAGMSAEKLLINALGTDENGPFVIVAIRNTRPWTHFVHPHTGKFTRLTDEAGSPIYPAVDFNLIQAATSSGTRTPTTDSHA